jgi:tetraacyldisaccharide 4'-kinase
VADLEALRSSLLERASGRALLRVIAFGWQGTVQLRAWAYDQHLLRAQRVEPVVISVGNLLVGGTGKTPLAQALAIYLQEQGWRVALVSRGYGGRQRQAHIVSTGTEIVSDVHASGDEAIASAETLCGCAGVVSGADRVAAAHLAHRALDAQVVVLDDGFQHRRLARDLDLLILPDADAERRGDLASLPLGRLREGLDAARRADLLLHEGVAATPGPPTATRQPRVCFHLRPHGLTPLEGKSEEFPLEILRGQCVATVTAIARPERLRADLQRMGAKVVARHELGDHAHFTLEGVHAAAARAQQVGARFLITTTKDAVKLRLLGSNLGPVLPIRILQRTVHWSNGSQLLWQRLAQIMESRAGMS